MSPPDHDQPDTDGLQRKLIDAERKYYAGLSDLEEKLARIEALQDLSKRLNGYTELKDALEKLGELSVQEMGVEKAVITRPVEGGHEVCAVRGYSRARTRELRGSLLPADNPHLARASKTRAPQFFATLDGDLAKLLDLCQMILCPLHSDDGTFHGHYIVGFSARKISLFRSFREPDVAYFEMVASQVSAMLQNLTLLDTFRKFVPRQFLDRLGRSGIGKINLGEADKESLTILFADIRSFTSLSEKLQPQELLNFLNAYFARMNAPIHKNDGFIDKFIGDAIMALFINEEPAVAAKNAVRAALDMLQALDGFNRVRLGARHPPIKIGIGIHCGDAIIGTVGSADRMDSTVLGDSVNLASRIEGLTKVYSVELVISSQAYLLIKDDPFFRCRELDITKVRGKENPECIYEVYSNNTERVSQLKSRIDLPYRKALAMYRDEDWLQALVLFRHCQELYPDDPVTAMYIRRCTAGTDKLIGAN